MIHVDDFQDQLQIEHLSIDHVGNYTCHAKNTYGTDHMAIAVVMSFAPRWISGRIANEQTLPLTGVAGGVIQIDCRANAYPSPHIKVMKGLWSYY